MSSRLDKIIVLSVGLGLALAMTVLKLIGEVFSPEPLSLAGVLSLIAPVLLTFIFSLLIYRLKSQFKA